MRINDPADQPNPTTPEIEPSDVTRRARSRPGRRGLADMVVSGLLARMLAPGSTADLGTRVIIAGGAIPDDASRHATVWGAGVDMSGSSIVRQLPPALDVRAVRGPWTRRVLEQLGTPCPAVYGDALALTARFFPELRLLPSIPVSDALCVPDPDDVSWLGPQAVAAGLQVLTPSDDYLSALQTIARSSFVVGSSLSAVVIAESFGIPARLVRSRAVPTFSFRDYLAGSGRPFETVARSLDEACRMGGAPPPVADLDSFVEAFPYDLLGESRHAPEVDANALAEIDHGRWLEHWERDPDGIEQTEAWRDLLAEQVRAVDTPPVQAAHHLVAQRTWFYPDADVGTLDRIMMSLDAAARRDAESLAAVLSAAGGELEAVIYDYRRTPSVGFASLTLFNPTPADSPVLVEVRQGDHTPVEITTVGLTMSDTQVRIDLDAIIPPDWPDLSPADCTVTVTFASGLTQQAKTYADTRIPPFQVVAPETTQDLGGDE